MPISARTVTSRREWERHDGAALLRLERAAVFYGASQILFGVGLDVEKGQSMALLGRTARASRPPSR